VLLDDVARALVSNVNLGALARLDATHRVSGAPG
jgi:hypothetical protein